MSRVDVHAIRGPHLTLLRGREAGRVSSVLAEPGRRWRYSLRRRGFLAPTTALPDVEAYCQAYRLLLVISDDRSSE